MVIQILTKFVKVHHYACAYYARNFTYYSFQNFPPNIFIILLIITYYSHKILLTIGHAGNSGVR